MNQSRVRRLSTIQDEERPQKKTRMARTDAVSMLNQNGILNLLSGRDDEAERCFSQALRHVDSSLYPTTACCAAPWNEGETMTDISSSTKTPPISTALHNGKIVTPVEGDGTTEAQQADKTTLLYIYQRQEYDEGMYVYADALSLEEIPNEAMSSVTLLYNVGQTHVRRGKYYEAKKWFELALVRMRLAITGQLPPLDVVRIYHNLGHCFYRLGKNEDSLRCYKKALSTAVEAQLDKYHVASAQNCIAVLLFHNDLSRSEGALELFEWSLAVYRERFGEARQVATILNNIGRVYYLKGDYERALTVYEEALSIRRKTLGPNSIDVAATVCNTGQTHHQRGNLETAMMYYKEFLELAQGRLGANHRDIAIIYKCMAEIHHERSEMLLAKVMYEKALVAGKEALGPFHPELASTLNKLGNLHYEMQDLDTALSYYTEGLNVEKIVLDPAHPHVIVTLMNIAQIHRQRGNYAAALLKYAEMHALQVKSFGPNCLEVANTLSSMGLMEYQLKAYSAAFELYQEALRIQRDHYKTDDHVDIASSLNSIGLVLFNQGVHGLAKECFSDSLRIRRKLLGPNHRDVAILWYNIATIYLETGEDDLAIKMYKETLRVERLALGNKHHDVILTLQHLGLVHQQRGELDEALKYFSEALDIERAKEGSSQVAIGKLLNLIGNIHLQRADIPNMMECYTRASRIYKSCGQRSESLVIAGYNFYGLSKLHPPCAAIA